MTDTFTITLVSIVFFAFLIAFIKGRAVDKCLKGLAGDEVLVEFDGGKKVWGRLYAAHTGMELTYREKRKDAEGHMEASFILYKQEFSTIAAVIRYLDDLDEKGRISRQKELARAYHPRFARRTGRKINNIFKTVRDSLMDVVNLMIAQAKKSTPIGQMTGQQDKYSMKVRDELMSTMNNAYEPLIERHIGRMMVAEFPRGDGIAEYCGVLKEYTADFIELRDVEYHTPDGAGTMKADILFPRRTVVIRHLGE